VEVIMRIFVTGASGWIGSAVVSELLEAGHQVVGFARSDSAAAAVAALGADVLRGELDDLDSLRAGAAASEGVVHLGYNHDFSRMADAAQTDRTAIEAIGAALEGSGYPLVIASGTLGLAPGRVGTEQDRPDPSCIRVSRMPTSRSRSPIAAYGHWSCGSRPLCTAPVIMASSPHWSASHARRASPATSTTAPTAGPRYTASMPRTWSVSPSRMHQPARCCTPSQKRVCRHGSSPRRSAAASTCRSYPSRPSRPPSTSAGWADAPASNTATRELLDWQPTHPGLIEDLDKGHYFQTPAS
jgi:hypothetical protein